MSLSADQIKAATDVKIEKVTVPEWGGEVFVRTLTGAHLRKIAQAELDGQDSNLITVAYSLCDEQGNLLFDNDGVEILSNKSAGAIARLLPKIKQLNNMEPEAVDEAKKN